jgi:alkaline phosphatase D
MFLRTVVLLTGSLAWGQVSHQATGVKVGEVSSDSALVWMRVTANPERNQAELPSRGPSKGSQIYLPAGVDVNRLEGAAPGAPGRVRLRYSSFEDLSGAVSTAWIAVSAARDFSHQFRITGLKPDTKFYYSAETSSLDGKQVHLPLRGSFRTRPAEAAATEVTFTVVTGLMYKDLDDPRGFRTFQSMRKLGPHFIVPTGDNVYYDNEYPRANTEAIARYHWQRMFSLPHLVSFFLEAPSYWEKDDHDTFFNDCWPAMNPKPMLPFTFKDGQRIFLEQVPTGDAIYRTIRWGRDLQIWLPEGRDYRSPNNAPDGAGKSIWGEPQKRWLKQTLLKSDARWKVLVCQTPIVGPDRGNKGDNHANAAFTHEGDEFRQWVKENVADNFFVACGDRHWQYHSVHPKTGLNEFSCGPVSNEHAAGSPGENKEYHRFHLVKGGFLSVSVKSRGITFRLHDVDGKVVYEWSKQG